jgi:hypothetical protein
MRIVSTSNPLRGCNSDLAQYSNTPVPAPLIEDEDDFEAPGEFVFEIPAGAGAQGQPCCLGSAFRRASSNAAGTNGFVR